MHSDFASEDENSSEENEFEIAWQITTDHVELNGIDVPKRKKGRKASCETINLPLYEISIYNFCIFSKRRYPVNEYSSCEKGNFLPTLKSTAMFKYKSSHYFFSFYCREFNFTVIIKLTTSENWIDPVVMLK
jgi:hypothetical protein